MKKLILGMGFLSVIGMLACSGDTDDDANGLPNPASVYCEDNGGTLDIRSDEQGNQSGICVFPDGSECDEWAYFRGECKPRS